MPYSSRDLIAECLTLSDIADHLVMADNWTEKHRRTAANLTGRYLALMFQGRAQKFDLIMENAEQCFDIALARVRLALLQIRDRQDQNAVIASTGSVLIH